MKHFFQRVDGMKAFATVLVTVAALVIGAGYVAQNLQYETLFSLYVKQNNQLRENGIQPVTPSPSTVAQSGPAGAVGARGIDGATGARGMDGLTGVAGATGAAGAVGLTGITGTAGAPGSTGTAGTPGATGANGAAGTNGTNGEAPASWTYKDAAGITYTCARATPFDPTAPTYTCAATPIKGTTK